MAFFVGLTNNIGPISQHADIVFDRVVTNVGDAYDQDTGRFTAPVNGTYQFNVIIAAQGRQKVRSAESLSSKPSSAIHSWAPGQESTVPAQLWVGGW